MMKPITVLVLLAVLAGCSEGAAIPSSPSPAAAEPSGAAMSADAAEMACTSALALREGVNAVFVLPISSADFGGGREVFLSLEGEQWLCTTDARGNVNRLEQRT